MLTFQPTCSRTFSPKVFAWGGEEGGGGGGSVRLHVSYQLLDF